MEFLFTEMNRKKCVVEGISLLLSIFDSEQPSRMRCRRLRVRDGFVWESRGCNEHSSKNCF